jgi:hypothetical protein
MHTQRSTTQNPRQFIISCPTFFKRYLTAIEWESRITDHSPDSDVIETACWYIEAGMFVAAADVIVNHPLSRQSPQYISNLSARIRNLAHVGFDKDVSLPPTYFCSICTGTPAALLFCVAF